MNDKSIQLLTLVLVIVAVVLSGVSLIKISGVSKGVEDQGKAVAKLGEDVGKIRAPAAARPGARQRAPQQPTVVTVSMDDDPVLGDKNAPVTIIEFSDYQCPFCKRFHDQVFPEIKKNYIDTGKVRYVFRDNPLSFHPLAKPAAIAASCGGEQGKFWEFNDFLFGGTQNLQKEAILKQAEEIGLNVDKFTACLDDPKHDAEIQKDQQDAAKYGARGTPGFFVGKSTASGEIEGTYIRGAQPFPSFKTQIEKFLND